MSVQTFTNGSLRSSTATFKPQPASIESLDQYSTNDDRSLIVSFASDLCTFFGRYTEADWTRRPSLGNDPSAKRLKITRVQSALVRFSTGTSLGVPSLGRLDARASDDLADLSGDANTFKPKPAPIAFLNRDSTPDDQPLIVSSTPASIVKTHKGKAKAAQELTGTHGANLSLPRHSYFSTDMGTDIPSIDDTVSRPKDFAMGTTCKALVQGVL